MSSFSPCRGVGAAACATGTDIDGEAWANPPSIGCDEVHDGAATGPLAVSFLASFTNVTVGLPVDLTAFIDGRTSGSTWDFGDGTRATNQPYTTHAWTSPGDYAVTLRAYNESLPAGLSATLMVHVAPVTVHFVSAQSENPLPPFTNWNTAATNIQDAVDAATTGDEIVVGNGVYATGGRAVGTDLVDNRVAVDKPLTLRSVNGPQLTVIDGSGFRGAYLTTAASLCGFTVTNGGADVGGGVWCEAKNVVVSNCIVAGNSAMEAGGVYRGTLFNCTLAGNTATYNGGGAYLSTLNDCILTGNHGNSGGGAYESALNRCLVSSNVADEEGGGAHGGTLNNCVLTGNSAWLGGGVCGGTLNDCVLTGNSADWGGGAGGGYGWSGQSVELNNCTLTGNTAGEGGGVFSATLNNCIVYFNTALAIGANHWESTLSYCCTTPLPSGVGNIAADPQLASASHLGSGSPCRGAGSAAYATGTDIDGEAWTSPPSIGCDEYHAATPTGPLSVRLVAAFTNVATTFPVELTAFIEGRTTASVWEFGDGLVASNRPYATHAWAAPGDYVLVLRAYNGSLPAGVSATAIVHVVEQPVHYAAMGSANPVPPYLSWGTAAKDIQDAVDAATVTGAMVLVGDGIYASGGRAVDDWGTTNRVFVDKPLTLQSVNGPAATTIQGFQVPTSTTGDGAVRCVYLANGARLSGFTLTNGATQEYESGGGVRCESRTAVVSNCVLTGNSAAASGGGAYGGTLDNCRLIGNSVTPGYAASWSGGGGAYAATLNNCILNGNTGSRYGGGARASTLDDCTLTGNSAGSGGAVFRSILRNCSLTKNSANEGGGAASDFPEFSCVLDNCTLTGNSARSRGGGAFACVLNNCTLAGNSAIESGGGTHSSALRNCIVYYNTATNEPNYSATLSYCCTTPLPDHSTGNITNAPLFVDYAGGNLRLQSNSPCINAGRNAYAPGLTDLDGNPRIVSGTVDIGDYEFQGPGSMISYAWLQQFGLPTDASVDAADLDLDGHTTWQEWRCLTDPINALSALRLLSASRAGTNVTVSWQSVAGVSYFLERATNVAGPPPIFTTLATDIRGQPGTTSSTDTDAARLAPLFYRVGVK